MHVTTAIAAIEARLQIQEGAPETSSAKTARLLRAANIPNSLPELRERDMKWGKAIREMERLGIQKYVPGAMGAHVEACNAVNAARQNYIKTHLHTAASQ